MSARLARLEESEGLHDVPIGEFGFTLSDRSSQALADGLTELRAALLRRLGDSPEAAP